MKQVNKVTIINILSTVLLQGISFFTTPIFSRLLGSSQYGQYSLFVSWTGILGCFMGLGVGTAIATCKYEFKEKYEESKSSILLFGTIVSMFLCLLGIIFSGTIGIVIKFSQIIVIMIFFDALAQFIIGFVNGANTYEKKAKENFIITVTITILTILLSLGFLLLLPSDSRYFARILGTFIPHVVIAIVLWIKTFCRTPAKLEKRYIRYSLIIGIPVVFHSLSHIILSQSDRVMMQQFNIDDSEIGIYSLYYTLANVVLTILYSLNNSWVPFLYDDLAEKNMNNLSRKTKNYIELYTVLVIGFLLLSREVGKLMGSEEYWSGLNIIPILVISCFFTFMYQFPVNFELFHKKTYIVAIGTILSGLVNIGLNVLLIPKYGMYGAAIATAISYVLLFIIHYVVTKTIMIEKFYMNFIEFVPSLLLIVLSCWLFYFLKDIWILRWCLGAVIGLFEMYRIIKRKTIF